MYWCPYSIQTSRHSDYKNCITLISSKCAEFGYASEGNALHLRVSEIAPHKQKLNFEKIAYTRAIVIEAKKNTNKFLKISKNIH